MKKIPLLFIFFLIFSFSYSQTTCPTGEIPDCNGNCAPEIWVGDTYCDDGSWSHNGVPIYFNCEEFECDGGDCVCEDEPEFPSFCDSGDCDLLTFVVNKLPIAIVYATWSGLGVFTIALLGYFFFKQTLAWQAIAGLFLIVIGVILVNSFTVKIN